MVGAGALGAAPRPRAPRGAADTRVTLWNRTHSHAIATASRCPPPASSRCIADDLEEAVRDADIVSCATLSPKPLVHGAWLKPGAHVDLVGAYTPAMREADDAAIRRARVFVDSRRDRDRRARATSPFR